MESCEDVFLDGVKLRILRSKVSDIKKHFILTKTEKNKQQQQLKMKNPDLQILHFQIISFIELSRPLYL